MRTRDRFASSAAAIAAALLLLGIVTVAPGLVAARDDGAPRAASTTPVAPPENNAPAAPSDARGKDCGCDCQNRTLDRERLWPRPKVASQRPALERVDEIAALEALQVALSEVGDGATYVWHRPGGRLSGIVRPTTSFRSREGKICRHLELLLTAGTFTRRVEGVACRLPDGIWSLHG
jgi:hypothetical protein